MVSCLFIAALWSPAGKGIAFWLSCVLCFIVFIVTFPCGVLGQVWYLIALIPDLCLLTNFNFYIYTLYFTQADLFIGKPTIFAGVPKARFWDHIFSNLYKRYIYRERILGECRLILSLPGKALRALVESRGLPSDSTCVSKDASLVFCLSVYPFVRSTN